MSRKPDSFQEDWSKKKLEALRQQLAKPGEWLETADRLFHVLTPSSQELSVTKDDEEMLDLIVSDALNGVDITVQYPAFYRKLLANIELRQIFLETLNLLEKSQTESVTPLPEAPSEDLSFLKTAVPPPPTISQSPSGIWQATWQMFSDYLTTCFFRPLLPVYRSPTESWLEEQTNVLLQTELQVDNVALTLLLEAITQVEHPGMLALTLSVTSFTEEDLPPLEAFLTWGSYQVTAVLNDYGQVYFPPLTIEQVLDETGQAISSDLLLTLTPITP